MRNKLKEKIEIIKKNIKIKEIIIFVSILLYIAVTVYARELTNLDELWNFNFSNCVSKDMVPYRDFSMVQTPLLPLICRNNFKNFWTRSSCYEDFDNNNVFSNYFHDV